MKTKLIVALIVFCTAGITRGRDAKWYGSSEALRIAENILLYQRNSGGWPKNINMAEMLDENVKANLRKEKDVNDATIDNGATCEQLRFLANVYAATQRTDMRDAFYRGLDYLFKAQYPNGGWPQFYPEPSGYHRYITFNDNAMINVLNLLREIANSEKSFAFVDAERKQRAQKAVQSGIDCILKCQIVHEGKLLAWCAQHDEVTFEPRPARIYEKVSISGSESAGIVRFLMQTDPGDPRVERAIEAAALWFEDAKITGFRWQRIGEPNAPKGYDCKLIADPTAGPLWARFYEIGTNRPIFCDRDGVIRYDVAEISLGRRTGYSWYVSSPQKVFEKELPEWRKKHPH